MRNAKPGWEMLYAETRLTSSGTASTAKMKLNAEAIKKAQANVLSHKLVITQKHEVQ